MIIIPARLSSTRFAQKVLAPIHGVPMVVATAKRVKDIDDVIVATDDQSIADIVTSYGFKAVLTSIDHQSGTDRIHEAAKKLNLTKNEIIINVQADEPFIEPEVIATLKKCVEENVLSKKALMASCFKILNHGEESNPNIVKVVTNKNNFALYFSRSAIPFGRDTKPIYKGHLGLYGFTFETLSVFCSLSSSNLESTEKLEQLRALDNDYKIAMCEVQTKSFGIDTKEDWEKANQRYF